MAQVENTHTVGTCSHFSGTLVSLERHHGSRDILIATGEAVGQVSKQLTGARTEDQDQSTM